MEETEKNHGTQCFSLYFPLFSLGTYSYNTALSSKKTGSLQTWLKPKPKNTQSERNKSDGETMDPKYVITLKIRKLSLSESC